MAPKQALNRRSLMRATAWSTPVVLASATVPAYAASVVPSYKVSNGAFVQVINTNPADPYDTRLGTSSYDGGTMTANRDTDGIASAGTFTPGGTIEGSHPYGGVGFWISAPQNDVTGEFVEGTTVLSRGVTFSVTYTVVFAYEDGVYAPLEWNDGEVFKVVGSTVVGNTTNKNNIGFTATMGTSEINGNVWTGTVTYETTDTLTLSYPAGSYAQVLASHVPVYYDASEEINSFTATLQVPTLTPVISVNGTSESKSLPQQTQTATLNLNPTAG